MRGAARSRASPFKVVAMARRGIPTAAPRLPAESAPESWLRNIRFSGFTVLMLVLLILAVVVLAPNLRILIEQQREIAALQAEVDAAQESVNELTENVARWSDPAYIESQAREVLYYVQPGDISYLVVNPGETVATPYGLQISTELQTTRVDWVAALLSSVYTAGLTQAPPEQLEAPQ